jgi:tight adherence protein B
MAQTLGAIGRTIRDRIELSRRVQAQAVEVHASVVGIMAISYAVTFIMWRANPDSLREFLSSTIGAFFAASAIVLQAVGIFWISKMSRVRF